MKKLDQLGFPSLWMGEDLKKKKTQKFIFKPPKKPAKERDFYTQRYVTTKIGVNSGKVG